MNIKRIAELLTSTKALIFAAIALITLINELRLNVATFEIKESNEGLIKDQYKDLNKLVDTNRKKDSLNMRNFVEKLSIESGVVIDYSLIQKNTEKAVNDGFNDALAHQSMLLNKEKGAYSVFILEDVLGNLTLMEVVERKDTVPLIRPYMKIN